MKLNENDARAVDMLLNGLSETSAATAADGQGPAGTSTGAAHTAATPVGDAPTSGMAATSAASAMSDDLANRVTKVDDLLRLLDYLPAGEPPTNLVQRTMRRVKDARGQAQATTGAAAAVSPAAYSAAAPGSGGASGLSQSLHRSPAAGGDDDPATL